MRQLLDRVGLGRRDLRAWAMYDWANSAFQTTIIAAVFPIYYQKVAAAGQPEAAAMSRFAWATTLAILIVAIIAPVLGAIADYSAVKKRLLAVFVAIGASATAAMFWIERGDWQFALMLFVIGNVGVAGSIVFYESLLPHLVSERGPGSGVVGRLRHRLHGRRHAAGDQPDDDPEAGVVRHPRCGRRRRGCRSPAWPSGGWSSRSRCFARVAEPPCASRPTNVPAAARSSPAGSRLLETFHELRRYRHAFVFLLAFLLYNDGIQTMIRMATIYGTSIGLPESAMITRAAADAVHRRSVRVRVRHARRRASARRPRCSSGLPSTW